MTSGYVCLAGLVSAGLLLSGCTTPQQQAHHSEDLLGAAGFVDRPADTPARINALNTLPRDRVVRTVRNNQVVYMFADPVVCNCLYVGDQQAWDRYQQERLQLHLANEELETAQMSWDWGPWGPWY